MQQAASDNRLIYLSIGYFSCHWCHVMQRESYRDPEIGKYLNEHYLAVKVDRELRPELDRRMMAFVEAVRGAAGWPLNVFLTPDGYPVTGFTYLPPEQFLSALKQLNAQWQERQAEIKPAAQEYFQQTEHSESQSTLVSLPQQHFAKVVEAMVSQAMGIADELQGGFGNTSKFPSYPQMRALLAVLASDDSLDPDVAAFTRLTLDNMAARNLRDHINGGFFRYTTDPDWETPHYEKMLYDNAQMILLYLAAAELWPGQGYAEVALDTIDFLQNFLAAQDGGYYSSLSAVDELNIEGAAYLWTVEELQTVLDDQQLSAMTAAGIIPQPPGQAFQLNGLERLQPDMSTAVRSRLQRAERPVMPADSKKLASWNGLTLMALLRAEPFAGKSSRQLTDRLYQFIRDELIYDGQVIRFAGAAAAAETTLEDYAFVARALAEYAQQRNNEEAAKLANRVVQQAFQRFYQKQRWRQNPDSLIPGDSGSWVVQDDVLESPVTKLLESALMVETEPSQATRRSRELINRLTRDMLDVPYHYVSAIMLRHRLNPAAAAVPQTSSDASTAVPVVEK